MADKPEKNSEKGFLARTATYTTKRARRAQEKFMQKVGKLDETKDEVFDEFVSNFNKQQELDSNFHTLNQRLKDEVLEPLEAYHRPFADVKTKISKRGRKRVDYDHCRHVVDTLRAKGTAKTADAKKLSQAEDDYQKAKSIFVELTSELYDELPALYDSRIGYYVSCFQSVFTLEGVFHRDCVRIQNQLNDMMDQLIKDVSAGTYSTKKSFTRDDEQEISTITPIDPKPEGSLATFYDVAVPGEDEDSESAGETDTINGLEKSQGTQDQEIPPPPARPAPVRPAPSKPAVSPPLVAKTKAQPENAKDDEPSEESKKEPVPAPSSVTQSNSEAQSKEKTVEKECVVYRNPNSSSSPTHCNLIVPQSRYKVIATHSYTPEDEDELAFEKGELVHVVDYDDPEEQDEGWLMGILDSSGLKGVFPENFTKRIDT
eukprot:gene14182-5187_t